MSIAPKVSQFLETHNIPFDTISHTPSHSSVQTAIAAEVPLSSVAKAVILKDNIDNYFMAVVPASSKVHLKQIRKVTQNSVNLASESEVNRQFSDCQFGAIPPISQAYQMSTIWDDHLGDIPDVYLEAGDHETLIHLHQDAFQHLMTDQPHAQLCVPPEKPGDDNY
ncbi:hypothetical protein EOPP23_18465 [Endozoicomonas sp. OPT23]|uniref:aminoacyl-tRNA deacylase n=1 Tax=Endozoicomonas sp. OPT23 TaxID=2072845 RepID=UPI00129BD088|nr:YbaK/EbsC family protein [Endozoicomonas sp. OPT23]MRI34963.1 hypothetical protein [Endozoicomonas sp. OPT23]